MENKVKKHKKTDLSVEIYYNFTSSQRKGIGIDGHIHGMARKESTFRDRKRHGHRHHQSRKGEGYQPVQRLQF